MAKGHKTGGRTPGTPNKATQEFRQTVSSLLDKNSENVDRWLMQVADGDPTKEIKADPYKALSILAQLAEYAAPKLSRAEHVGEGGGPLTVVLKRYSDA